MSDKKEVVLTDVGESHPNIGGMKQTTLVKGKDAAEIGKRVLKVEELPNMENLVKISGDHGVHQGVQEIDDNGTIWTDKREVKGAPDVALPNDVKEAKPEGSTKDANKVADVAQKDADKEAKDAEKAKADAVKA